MLRIFFISGRHDSISEKKRRFEKVGAKEEISSSRIVSLHTIFSFIKETVLILLVFTVLAAVSSQDYSQLFAGFGPYIRQAVAMRDPRSNRGPVLFPPGPPPNNEDSSGVIVGASGYGFVPPNQAFYRFFYY
ncbi:uncharacterized protein LOC107996352 isoform X1 [Apis cerana]|uniref:uncharacterized protein LOC107996352 isoform X1 n=1 Tax=Apis cerana TaxID=7461 RepID=UPI00109BACB5|nr:uncharacterized protein LOC107996352 isoform X1 [Apis cerana]